MKLLSNNIYLIFDKNKRKAVNQMLSESVIRRCSIKRVYLEITQNSQGNTCVRLPFFTEHLWWLLLHTCLFSKKYYFDLFTEICCKTTMQ